MTMRLGRVCPSRCWRGAHSSARSGVVAKHASSVAVAASQAHGAVGQAVVAPPATPPAQQQVFRFRHFAVAQGLCNATHKVGTDAMLLGSWCHPGAAMRVLDVGTGTGVLALMVAQRAQHGCHIDAIDVNAAAVQQAAANVAASPSAERVAVHHNSLQEWLAQAAAAEVDGGAAAAVGQGAHSSTCNAGITCRTRQPGLQSYDLIISNPPYFLNSSKPGASLRAAARHADVLLPFPVLAQGAAALLVPGGALAVVLPVAEGELFAQEAAKERLALTHVCHVRTRAADAASKRVLMRFKRLCSSSCGIAGAEVDAEVNKYVVGSGQQPQPSQHPGEACHLHTSELVITERQWSSELGREVTRFTAAYLALTHEYHHPDYL